MSKKVLVVGAGAWGTAIANVLSKNNNEVYLWTRDNYLSERINLNNINQKYYKNYKLFKNLTSNMFKQQYFYLVKNYIF